MRNWDKETPIDKSVVDLFYFANTPVNKLRHKYRHVHCYLTVVFKLLLYGTCFCRQMKFLEIRLNGISAHVMNPDTTDISSLVLLR